MKIEEAIKIAPQLGKIVERLILLDRDGDFERYERVLMSEGMRELESLAEEARTTLTNAAIKYRG